MNSPGRAVLFASILFTACSDDPAGTSGASADPSATGTATSGTTSADSSDPGTSSATSGAASSATSGATSGATSSDPGTSSATSSATSGDPGTSSATSGDPSTAGTTAMTTASTGPAACGGGGLGPGDHDIMLTHDGKQRHAIVHVPKNYDADTPTPLVVNMHGWTMTAQQQVAFTAMSPKADSAGFVVVYPDGISNSWNAGGCCGVALDQNIDDVGFLRALVDLLEGELCIDHARIYATGMSNGGYMSNRLACEASDLFAAVAPVSSSIGLPQCDPGRPVPIILFNGTNDLLVPYDGGAFPGAKAVAAGWAARNGCTGDPVVTKQAGGSSCETYETCDAGATVTLCTLAGMGHCWPGQAVCPYGAANTDLSANDEMWDLFSKVSLP